MSKQKINTISKIIGIYYDNAIEAAKESRKKKILIEIYEIKDKVKIVISNTYNKKKLIFDNKKGLSSKGNNRGKGLYFAKRIIADNKWIQTNKEIIDNAEIKDKKIQAIVAECVKKVIVINHI